MRLEKTGHHSERWYLVPPRLDQAGMWPLLPDFSWFYEEVLIAPVRRNLYSARDPHAPYDHHAFCPEQL